METTSTDDILLRIDALKGLGAACGGVNGQRWILLDGYTKEVTGKHPNAIAFVELLGVRDESMKTNFAVIFGGGLLETKRTD